MGSDLTYRCLGGNTYEITLSFYRDCAGIEADTQAFIVFQSSCFPADSILIYQVPGTGQEISPVCPSEITTCNDGTFTGIQEYIYRGVVTLPGPCADWTFSYNLCCRNFAITNINQPGSTEMFIYANLNNTGGVCNNSPVFSNKPVPFVCLGQQFCFNHGGYDPDGDSLVYQMITPFDQSGLPVSYLPPFSSMNPLSSTPAISFNSATGDICMTPTQLEVTVMAVLVSEYRNGVLIGQVERDIQVTVITCSNIIPSVSGINGTNNFSLTVCAGVQTCFDIFSADQNGNQNTYVSWDYSIPGGIFTTIPGPRETASFCWTPQQSDISTVPHCFTVTVVDDNCPYAGTQTFSYCITVRGLEVDAGADLSVGCNSTVQLTAAASGGSGNYTYQWNTGQSGPAISTGPGTFIVTASDGVCVNEDTVTVLAGNAVPTAAFQMSNNCTSLSVTFLNQSSIVGGTITAYSWDFGDGTTSSSSSPTHVYAATGNYLVTLIVQSAGGCIDTVSQLLNLSANQPTANFTLANVCVGAQVNFTNTSVSPSAFASYHWSFGDGDTSTVRSPAHVYSGAGTFNVTLTVVNIDGCTSVMTRPLTVYPLPPANAGSDISICRGATGLLSASGGSSYVWYPGGSTGPSLVVSPTQSMYYVVNVTSANGCIDSDTVNVFVRRPLNLNLGQPRRICSGDSVTIGVSTTIPLTYLWNPGGATTPQIRVSPSSTTDYFLAITDTNGCTVSDTVQVIVNARPVVSAGPPQSICSGDTVILSASGAQNYSWTPGGFGQQISVFPVSTTYYTVNGRDQNGCTDTSVVQVTVQASISPNAGVDRSICSGDSVVLSVTGGSVWSWSPGGQTSQTITVQPAVSTVYTVVANPGSGCSGSAMVQVVVNNPPQADAGAGQFVCPGGTVLLNGSGGSAYWWSPGGASTQQLVVTPSGTTTYLLTVTDTNGCIGTDSVLVTVHPAPAVSAGSPQSVCVGDSVTLNASGANNYLWSNGAGSQQTIVSPVSTSVYTVTGSDLNGCSDTSSVVITVNPLPSVDAGLNQVICAGDTVALQVAGGSAWSWNPGGQTTQAISVSPAGTTWYVATVNDSNSCSASDSVQVIVNPLPLVFAGLDQSVCSGSSVLLSASGASVYNWMPGNIANQQFSVTPVSSTYYTVTAVDLNGCQGSDTVLVLIHPLPVVSVNAVDALCNGSSTGTATALPAGGTAPYTYAWIPSGGTGVVASSLAAGAYSVLLTDDNGCTATSTANIGEPSAMGLSVVSTPVLCNGQSNGTASISAAGGASGYTYTWSPSGGSDTIASGLSAGIYSVTVTDANGCTGSVSVTVQQPAALSLQLNSTPASCNGNSDGMANVAVSGGTAGYTYLWTPGGGTASTASGLAAGRYRVTISDGNGCVRTDSILVTEPPSLVLQTGNAPATCGVSNGSVNVIASGGTPGYQYLWSPGNATSAVVNSVAAGAYTVYVEDANGCTETAGVVVPNTGAPVVSANVISHVSCFGGNDGSAFVQVISGNGPFTFSWPQGRTNDTVFALSAGSYPVTVTDLNGCIGSDIIDIVQPTPLTSVVSATAASCNGFNNGSASVIVAGGSPSYSYNWNPGNGTTNTFTGLAAGSYTVTITDANGCTHSAAALITEPPELQLGYTGYPVSCYDGTDGSAILNYTGGFGGYLFSWSPAGGANDTATGLRAGNYTVIMTDGAGCTEQLVVAISQPDSMSLFAVNGQVSCSGASDGAAGVIVSGGNGSYQYVWQPGGAVTANIQNVPSGNYQVTVTDFKGCSSVAAAFVADPDPVVLQTAGPPVACIGQQVVLSASASGGTGPFTFHWDNGETGDSIFVSPVVSMIYNVTVIDANGCTASPQPVQVMVHPPLTLHIDSLPEICGGEGVLLSSSASGGNGGPYFYNWNDSAILVSTTVVRPTDDSLFVLTVTDGCSQPVTGNVAINVNPLPVVQFIPQQISGCMPVSVSFQNLFPVPSGSSYSWDLDDNFTSSDSIAQHVYESPGLFNVSLVITTPEGCAASMNVENAVEVFGFPVADFSQSSNTVSVFTPDISFYDESDGAYSWMWDFGDGSVMSGVANPVHQYGDSGTYVIQLVVTGEGGCPDTAWGTVRVEPEFTIFIPNAFTPNGDGRNDSFTAIGENIIQFEMWIIDRWGLEIFHSDHIGHPWDGTYYGGERICQNDVYEYVIKVVDVKNRDHKFIGHVTLVR